MEKGLFKKLFFKNENNKDNIMVYLNKKEDSDTNSLYNIQIGITKNIIKKGFIGIAKSLAA